MTERYLTTAVGAQLDGIGRVLGVARAGRNDTQYRVWLTAEQLVLKSNGRTVDLLGILATILTGGETVEELPEFPAAFTLNIVDPIDEDLGNQLAQLIIRAKGGGIRLVVQWRRVGDTFKYSDVFGTDSGVTDFGYGSGEYSATSDGTANIIFEP